MKSVSAALILLFWLGPSFSATAQIPDDKTMNAAHQLRQFLQDNVPADSPLKADDNFGHEELTRLDHLDHARPLHFFQPLKLVAIVHMDPLAGAPGEVLDDIRVVYDPDRIAFAISSIEWINTYRQRTPLPPEELTEEELKAYIEEMVSLLPGGDRWGFRVLDLEPTSHRSYEMRFEEPFEMNGLGGGSTEIRFTPQGGIASCDFLEELDPTR